MRRKLSLLERLLNRGLIHAKKDTKAAPAPDYAAAASAQGAANKDAALATAALNSPNQVTPQGNLTWTIRPGADPTNPQPGDWTATTSLSPDQQQLYSSNMQTQQGLAALGNKAIGSVSPVIGTDLDTKNLPGAVTSNIPTSADAFANDAAKARQSYYDTSTRLYGEQFGQQEDALRTQLANQGFQEGSAGYTREMNNFQRNRDTAYQNAADTATQKGYDLQSQQLSNLINATGAQNASRSSGIQQQAALRELPINEIIGLMSGTQVSNPQFSQGGTGAQVQAAPMYNAFNDSANAKLGASNANAASNQALYGGLTTLAMAAMFASDRRLKQQVELIGEVKTLSGHVLPLYTFRYVSEPRWAPMRQGVMAQDVVVVEPTAVMRNQDGFMHVNYTQLFGGEGYRYA